MSENTEHGVGPDESSDPESEWPDSDIRYPSTQPTPSPSPPGSLMEFDELFQFTSPVDPEIPFTQTPQGSGSEEYDGEQLPPPPDNPFIASPRSSENGVSPPTLGILVSRPRRRNQLTPPSEESIILPHRIPFTIRRPGEEALLPQHDWPFIPPPSSPFTNPSQLPSRILIDVFRNVLVRPLSIKFPNSSTSSMARDFRLLQEFVRCIFEIAGFAQVHSSKWDLEFFHPSPLKVTTLELKKFLDSIHRNYWNPPLSRDWLIIKHGGVGTQLNHLLQFHLYVETYGLFPTEDQDQDPKFLNPTQCKIKVETLELFDCPVCYSTIFPPIYQCKNSHLLCENCNELLIERPCYRRTTYTMTNWPHCPVCRTRLVGLNATESLGQLHELLKFQCGFKDCAFEANGLEIKKHMNECCVKKTWKCVFCPTTLTLDSVLFHLAWDHGFKNDNLRFSNQSTKLEPLNGIGIQSSTFSVDITWTEKPVSYHIISLGKDKYFVLYQLETEVGLASEVKKIMWIPCFVGTEEEAKNYRMRFEIKLMFGSKNEDLPRYTASLTSKRASEYHVASIQKEFRSLIIEYGLEYNNQVPSVNLKCWDLKDPGTLRVEILDKRDKKKN